MNPMSILTGLSVVVNSMKMAQRDEVILLAYVKFMEQNMKKLITCILYTSDAADNLLCVDFGCRRLIKKK